MTKIMTTQTSNQKNNLPGIMTPKSNQTKILKKRIKRKPPEKILTLTIPMTEMMTIPAITELAMSTIRKAEIKLAINPSKP